MVLFKQENMLKKKRTAYSLLELSIVIVIISILITGAMTTAVGNISNAKSKVTKDKLQAIYKALGNFVATNGRLPCPASIILLKSDVNYGTSAATPGDCSASVAYPPPPSGVSQSSVYSNLVFGMVPAVTLGLSKDMAEDGFEDKIAYVVSKNFTASANLSASPNFTQTNFSINTVTNSNNNIFVIENSGSSTIHPATNGVFVLISYGPNKKGAYGINSTTRNAASSDAYEIENGIEDMAAGGSGIEKDFYSVARNSDTFDDIILYSNPGQMVAEFDLYRLLPCNNNLDANYNTNVTPTAANDLAWNAWFGQVVYGKPCTGSDFDKNYVKKCGAAGTWIVMNTCTLP